MKEHKGVVITIQNYHPYYHTCAEAAAAVERMEKESKTNTSVRTRKNQPAMSERDKIEYQHTLRMRTLTAPIFGAIAAENFIYNYGCEFLSAEFCNENLDKLDTLSKWKVIPQLACGKAISSKNAIFSELRELIKVRNSLVHLRAKVLVDPPMDRLEKMTQSIKTEDQMLRKIAKRAPKTVTGLVEALVAIDPRDEVLLLAHNLAIPIKVPMPNNL